MAVGVGLLRPTPLAVSITFSSENVGEEEAAEAEPSQNYTPERAREDAHEWLFVRIVERIEEKRNFV